MVGALGVAMLGMGLTLTWEDLFRAVRMPGQVALGAYNTGNALPAYTPLTAYIGHGPETVNLAAKAPRVTTFYASATTKADRRQLLADGRVTWVIFGPAELRLGDFNPASAAYLQPAFSNGTYAVYRVVP